MSKPCVLVVLSILGAGCADGRSLLTLTVAANAPLEGIDHLVVTLRDAQGRTAQPITQSLESQDGKLPPDRVLHIGFDKAIDSNLAITVEAVAADNTVIGAGTGAVHIAPSQTRAARVELLANGTGPPRLGASRLLVDFGSVVIGEESAEEIVVITNNGGEASSALVTAKTGAASDRFALGTTDCMGVSLAVGASCTVRLRFQPDAVGLVEATLAVKADNATVNASVMLKGSGSAVADATLTVSPPILAFGDVIVGMTTATSTFTIANTGTTASGVVATSLTGDTGDFVANDGCSGMVLAPSSGCDVTIAFRPTAGGAKSMTLGVSASPGGSPATVVSTGTGLLQATLTVVKTGNGRVTSSPAGIDCGSTCSEKFVQGSTVNLAAAAESGSVFTGWSGAGCSGTNDCTVTLASAQTVNATFAPVSTLNVEIKTVGGASGTVTSSPTGIVCGSDCGESYLTNATVTLTPNVSTGYFGGWTGDCTGMGICTVTMSQARSVKAAFIPANIVFKTSTNYQLPLGSNETAVQDFADGECAARARSVGLGGTFVAWLSTTNKSALSKLAGKGGWVFPNGNPFVSSLTDLTSGRLMYTMVFDETGAYDASGYYVMTGTGANGLRTGTNCADFTSTTGSDLVFGNPWGGEIYWTQANTFSCSPSHFSQMDARFYCFEVDHLATGVVGNDSGRYAFVSTNKFAPSSSLSNPLATADGICNADKGTLPGTYKAFLATSTATAISRFDVGGAPWMRPDHVLLAPTPTDFVTRDIRYSAPTVLANGTFTTEDFFVGCGQCWLPSVMSSTCNDWKSNAALPGPPVGDAWTGILNSGNQSYGAACGTPLRLLCLQE